MPPEIQDFLQSFSETVRPRLPEFALRLLGVVVLLLVGRWLAQRAQAFVNGILQRSQLDKTVISFFSKAAYALVLLLVFIAALSLLGIPMTSVVAILGASTLAIGLALQDSLANLAAGLLLVFLKPFAQADLVRIGSDKDEGTVRRIQFFHTELLTGDNKVLLVPNSDVMENPILNYTRMDNRRIDLIIAIDYSEDLRKAKEILNEIIAADGRILPAPVPRVAVNELGESSVNLLVQPFVRTSDYEPTRTDLIERIKLRFDEAGITAPYPQRVLRVTPDVARAATRRPEAAGDR